MSPAFQEFFKSVGKTRLLTKEEEVMLAQKIEKGDQRARDRMIRANLRLAISIAKKYNQLKLEKVRRSIIILILPQAFDK